MSHEQQTTSEIIEPDLTSDADVDKTVIAPESGPSIGIRYADMRARANQVLESDNFDELAYDLELPRTDRAREPPRDSDRPL